MPEETKNILIIENDPVIAGDIADFVKDFGYKVCGVAYNDEDALELLNRNEADFVLLDIDLGCKKSGIDIAHIINRDFHLPFAFITSFITNNVLDKVKDTYPVGYIVKPFNEKEIRTTIEIGYSTYYAKFISTVPLTISGLDKLVSTSLSEREFETLLKLNEGKSNKQIAEELFVSLNTVKTHLKNIFIKLNVTSRSEAMAVLKRYGR